MGKGDRRTKKGKRYRGSYGVSRLKTGHQTKTKPKTKPKTKATPKSR
jgi:ribosomal small subunit protein bTHX